MIYNNLISKKCQVHLHNETKMLNSVIDYNSISHTMAHDPSKGRQGLKNGSPTQVKG